MGWKKLGLLFCPQHRRRWMWSHASNPFAIHREKDIFRIYFSTRDASNRSSVGYIDVDLSSPKKILSVSKHPVLTPGPRGGFDDSGISLGCITPFKDTLFLYYVGWNLGVTIPWRNSIGVALLNKRTGTFEKHSLAPILDRSEIDPYSLSYCFVAPFNGSLHMWYGSDLSWEKTGKNMKHVIKYATSQDGIHWTATGIKAISLRKGRESAVSRPSVIINQGHFEMWYSTRQTNYRIGYAKSQNGIQWTRNDFFGGLSPSKTGWDSQMVEYPHVFEHKGKRYMLYNGNSYGKTGFGLAVWD